MPTSSKVSKRAAPVLRTRTNLTNSNVVELKKTRGKSSNTQHEENSGKRMFISEDADFHIVEELKAAHKKLCDLHQSQVVHGNEDLKRITDMLLEDSIFFSQSSRVRGFAAQCFADVLFLHAPEAPYGPSTLKSVMIMLIESIKGLEAEKGSEQMGIAMYVLHRMSSCKLGCILADLPDSIPGETSPRTSEVASTMFKTVFESLNPSHDGQIESDAMELLVGYLEELSEEEFPMCVLDTLLSRLLPELRRDSYRAYDVARNVIGRCADRLRGPLTTLLNGLLLGDYRHFDQLQEAESSAIKNAVHTLVLELFRINPNILLHLLPSIESLLGVDDTDSRVKAVRLLCDMLGNLPSEANFEEYETLVAALFQRINDKTSQIRLLLVEFAGKSLLDANLSRRLRHLLIERPLDDTDSRSILERALEDSDPTVRAETVEAVSSVLQNFAMGVKNDIGLEALARSLGWRVHDLSTDIAIRAMEGLCWLYQKEPISFGWVPNLILGDETRRESSEDYFRVEETRLALIDAAMMGPSANEGTPRVHLFYELYSGLNARAQATFLRCVIKLRSQVRASLREAIEENKSSIPTDVLAIVRADEQTWQAMWTLSDNKIRSKWQLLLSPSASRSDLNEVRKDLVERVGAAMRSQHADASSISKTKALVRSTCRWASLATLSAEELSCAAFFELANDDSRFNLAKQLIVAFPEAFTSDRMKAAFADRESLDSFSIGLVCSVLMANPESKRGLAFLTSRLFRVVSLTFSRPVGFKRALEQGRDFAKAKKLACRALLLISPDCAQTKEISNLLEREADWAFGDLSVALCTFRTVKKLSPSTALLNFCTEAAKRPYRSDPVADELLIKELSLKIIIEFLLKAVQDESLSDSQRAKSLILMLRSFVSDMGDPWSGQSNRAKGASRTLWPPNDSILFTRLRLISAVGLMKLECTSPRRSGLLAESDNELSQLKRSARRVIERSRLAFDPDPASREFFRRKINDIDLAAGVNMHRNGALLAVLAALHDGSLASNRAQTDLRLLIRFLAQKSQSHKLTDEAKAVLFAPELILPNLVYILAHHPLLPADNADFAQFLKENQRLFTIPIVRFLDAVASVHGKSSNRMDASVSFMLTTLGLIRTRKDILDDHHGIYCISDLAKLVLLEHIKHSAAALEPHRGTVPLPKVFLETTSNSLLRTPTSRTTAEAPSPISYLPAGFELSLSAVKKQRGERRITKKRASGLTHTVPVKSAPTRSLPRRSTRVDRSFREEDSQSDSSTSNGEYESD